MYISVTTIPPSPLPLLPLPNRVSVNFLLDDRDENHRPLIYRENLPGLVGKFRKLFYRYSSSATILFLAIFRDGKVALSSRHTRLE